MKSPIPIHLAVEDKVSEATLRKIINKSGKAYFIGTCYSHFGSGYLKKNIHGFNKAAKSIPFLVLTDLDKSSCPPIKIKEWLPVPKNPNLLFRIAVKEVESWIPADRDNFAKFLGISKNSIPVNADIVDNPKEFLIHLAKKSKIRDLRESIVPPSYSTARQGPDYNGRLIYFIQKIWEPQKAMGNSESLKRTLITLQNFSPHWRV